MIHFNWKTVSNVRRAKGLTQKKLAQLAGVSLRTIEGIEAGKVPSVATAGQLAQALELPLARLIEQTEACGELIEAALVRYAHAQEDWQQGVIEYVYDRRDELDELTSLEDVTTMLSSLELEESGEGESRNPSWGGVYQWVRTHEEELKSLLDDFVDWVNDELEDPAETVSKMRAHAAEHVGWVFEEMGPMGLQVRLWEPSTRFGIRFDTQELSWFILDMNGYPLESSSIENFDDALVALEEALER